MATLKTLTCSCCGSDVTCPQYYQGKVYGYTCITKVAPKAKKVKTVMAVVEVVSME